MLRMRYIDTFSRGELVLFWEWNNMPWQRVCLQVLVDLLNNFEFGLCYHPNVIIPPWYISFGFGIPFKRNIYLIMDLSCQDIFFIWTGAPTSPTVSMTQKHTPTRNNRTLPPVESAGSSCALAFGQRPLVRFLTNLPRPWFHVPVFYTSSYAVFCVAQNIHKPLFAISATEIVV